MSKRFYVLYTLKEFYLPRIYKTKATINKYIEENNKLEFKQFAKEEEAQLFSKSIEAKLEKKFKMKMVEYLQKSHREIEEINEKSGSGKKAEESEEKKGMSKKEEEKEGQDVKKGEKRQIRQQQSKMQIAETKIVQEKVEEKGETKQETAKKPEETIDNNLPQKQETKSNEQVEKKQQQVKQQAVVEQKKEAKEQVIEVTKEQIAIVKEQTKEEVKQQVIVKEYPKQEIVKQELELIIKEQIKEQVIIITKQPQSHEETIVTSPLKQQTPILVANHTAQHSPNLHLHHLFYPLSPKYLSFLYPKVIKYYNFPSICSLLRFHHLQQAKIPKEQLKNPLTLNISLIFKQNPGLSLAILDMQFPFLPKDVNYLKTVVLGVKGKEQAKILALIQGIKYASTFGKSSQLTINSNFPSSSIKNQQKSLDARVRHLVSQFLIEKQSFSRVNYV